MNIPATDTRDKPELLLYRLGDFAPLDQRMYDRIQDFTNGDGHVYLSDASGTGKTRLLYETMARRWGLYFTCCTTPGTSPYGSSDMSIALDGLLTETVDGWGLHPAISLSKRISKKALSDLTHNRRIAQRVFYRMILARLLCFERFLRIVKRLGVPDSEACYRWLLIQLGSESIFHDPFQLALSSVTGISDDEVKARLLAVSQEVKNKLEFVIIDDIQVVKDFHSTAFTTSDNSRHVSVLREVLVAFGNNLPESRIIVSGSDLDMSWANEALLASGTRRRSLRHFHDLGNMNSQVQCTEFLKHFFGDLISDNDCCLAYKWVRGRYRIISSLVTFTLLLGARHFRQVLETMVYYNTMYKAPGSAILPYDWLFETFKIRIEHEEENDMALYAAHRRAAMNFIYRRMPTTYSSHCSSLVAISSARFGDDSSSAVIWEPLVLLSLTHWLTSSGHANIHNFIRDKIANMSRPMEENAFVEGLAPCLWNAFEHQMPISDLFRFPAAAPISKKSASIVLPKFSHRLNKFAGIPERPKTLLRFADSPDDVFAWLRNASEPFLIPDANCAADMLFVIKLDDAQYVLAALQLKNAPDASKSRPERDHRIVPADVNEFYKKIPEAQEQFEDLLEHFPQLPLGTHKRSRAETSHMQRFARYPVLRLLCFSEPWRANEAYDPPVAMINFQQLLSQPAPEEFTFSDAAQFIVDGMY